MWLWRITRLCSRLLAALIGLAGLVLPILLARWMIGLGTPRRDLVTAQRIGVAMASWWQRILAKVRTFTYEQTGITELRWLMLRQKLAQGRYGVEGT